MGFPDRMALMGFFGRTRAVRPVGLGIKAVVTGLPLISLVKLSGRRIGLPQAALVARKLTGTTVRQNLTDGKIQAASIIQAIEHLKLPLAGMVSDTTVEAEACGCRIEMPEEALPYIVEHPIKTIADIEKLKIPDPLADGRLPVFVETISLLKKRFALPIITGSVGPFSLAGSLADVSYLSQATILDKPFAHKLLEYSTKVLLAYLRALIAAGGDIICVSEPTGSLLSKKSFREFGGAYLKQIFDELKKPSILHVCGSAGHLIEEMVATGANCLSLDAAVELPKIVDRVPPDVIIAGNLDPVTVLLEMKPDGIRNATNDLLEKMRPVPNYVCASGCDLAPETAVENVEAMIDAIAVWR